MNRILICIIVNLCYSSLVSGTPDCLIQIGRSDIFLHVDSTLCNDPNNIAIMVETSSLYSNFGESATYPLTMTGSYCYSGSVPLEMTEALAGFTCDIDNRKISFLAPISQNHPTVININSSKSGDIAITGAADHERLAEMSTALLRFYANTSYVPDSCYRSWQTVREYENRTLWPTMLKEAVGNITQYDDKSWLINNLKCRFASQFTLPFTKAAERCNGLTVEEPPMESYAFLDSIDCSGTLLWQIPSLSVLRSFLYALLRFPDGGFDPIAETPVNDWIEYAAGRLAPAIEQPDRLLLELLSGMSYIAQIEIDGTPLSSTQIGNVNRGYDSDLGIVILLANDRLCRQTAVGKPLYTDLTSTEFDLKQYIDSVYPGKSVVVDCWETWCIPCLNAIKMINALPEHRDDAGVIYLYVCSESSNEKKLQSIIPSIAGHHIKINSSEAVPKLGETYGLTGFPSYIFFDKKHNVIHKQTGFPGINEYINSVKRVKSASNK